MSIESQVRDVHGIGWAGDDHGRPRTVLAVLALLFLIHALAGRALFFVLCVTPVNYCTPRITCHIPLLNMLVNLLPIESKVPFIEVVAVVSTLFLLQLRRQIGCVREKQYSLFLVLLFFVRMIFLGRCSG